MINKIFPHNHFYVKFKAPNVDELFEFVSSKEEDFSLQPWQKKCKLNTINCDWKETLELMQPSVDKFASFLGKPFEYTLYDPWINCYSNGFFQELHDHRKVDFSSVFFVNTGEDFGKFYFYNRNSNSLPVGWDFLDFTDTFYPDIEAGDIIFFPSNELHGVTVHNTDVVRKTLACNYTFKSRHSSSAG